MYYYGNNGYYGNAYNPCPTYSTYTYQGNMGAAIWIVLFILLVIIIGAGWFNNIPNR